MPKQTRWRIKQTMAEAVLSTLKAQTYLINIGTEFETVHPDYYDGFCVIVQSLEQCKTAIEDLMKLV